MSWLLNRAQRRLGRWRDELVLATLRARAKGTITVTETPRLDWSCRIRAGRGARVELGRNVRLGRGFTAEVAPGGVLHIGDDTAFNVHCWIGVTSRISIEGDCLVGPFVSFTDGNHAFSDSGEPFWRQGYELRPVTVGRNVWIGAKATVIHDIGPGSVIGANAVVSRPVPAGVVAAGVPARVVRPVARRPDGEAGPG